VYKLSASVYSEVCIFIVKRVCVSEVLLEFQFGAVGCMCVMERVCVN